MAIFRKIALALASGCACALSAPLDAAKQAFAEGLPTVAAGIAEKIDPSTLDANLARERAVLLARCHIENGNFARASEDLEAVPPTPETAFWKAQNLAAEGAVEAALDLYRSLRGDPSFGGGAANGEARMLAAKGDFSGAEEALSLLPEAARTTRDSLDLAGYMAETGKTAEALALIGKLKASADPSEICLLTAMAAFLAGDMDAAAAALEDMPPGTPEIQARAALLSAEVSCARNQPGDAEKTLEKFLDRSAWPPFGRELFARLDDLYAAQESPSLSDLARWADSRPGSPRSTLARYYLARNEAKLARRDRAEADYRAFLAAAPSDPLAAAARRELALLASGMGRTGDALTSLEGNQSADADFLRGLAFVNSGDFASAERFFRASAAASGLPAAQFNAALAGVLAGSPVDAGGEIPIDVAKALEMARKREPGATETLDRLAASTPRPWSELARLAAAESRYMALDFEGARRDIRKISNPAPQVAEDAAALEVFLADDGSPDSAPAVENASKAFLSSYPKSSRRAEVLMKLGEVLFRKGDYVSARARFSEASAAAPGGELDERALFLAAQAASRSMDPASTGEAIEIYEDLVGRGGPLALRSRLAQALLLNAAGRPQEALAVLDKLLASNPDDELRWAAITEKGDTYFALGPSDAQAYPKAVEAWKPATAAGVPARWRNQALTKSGAALEKTGDADAALSSYYAALEPSAEGEPEFFWFYKAGFDAARLLESKGRIAETANLYEKLAATDGPRSEEARQKLNRLRLENFLWDNTPDQN